MGAVTELTILGSTGSIGTQVLDVVSGAPDRFWVGALAAHRDVDTIVRQAEAFGVRRLAMGDPAAAARVRERLPGADVLEGPDGVVELATGGDTVVNAVMGASGLRATLAALDAGRRVALANKESCVAAGPLVRERLDRRPDALVPIDSEHASVHMCLRGEVAAERLVLTASGGPFRGRTADELADVTPEDALRHPTWDMGAKITIDSATLMNKGLEVIEAHVLFGFDYDAIDVVCHPSSIIHCLVGFADGSWKSALGPPDMRVPIAYALGGADRLPWGADSVDWSRMDALTFEPVDTATFRCLALAYEAGRAGGTAPAVLNAANEVAVAAFLGGQVGFGAIPEVVERVLGDHQVLDGRTMTLDEVIAADGWARERANTCITEG